MGYRAKLFKVDHLNGEEFKVAGTLGGEIDLAVPTKGRTFQLSVKQAKALANALFAAAKDVEKNSKEILAFNA